MIYGGPQRSVACHTKEFTGNRAQPQVSRLFQDAWQTCISGCSANLYSRMLGKLVSMFDVLNRGLWAPMLRTRQRVNNQNDGPLALADVC